MKKFNVVATVCLAVGFAVFMAADSSIAAGNILGKDTQISGKGHGPGDGTGNGGSGPKDGTGNGSKQGSCTNLISDLPVDGLLIAGKGNGKGYGPGDGTGNGGSGPKDGSGYGSKSGTCTKMIMDPPNEGILQ
jgi:hypothetical protein